MHLFFFSSRRRHTRSTRDWSSDVCSSDLKDHRAGHGRAGQEVREHWRARTARAAAGPADAHGQAVGDRERPRDADRADEAGPEGVRARGRDRPGLQRRGRELRRRHRLALQPAAAGERERQLREGRAAHPRADHDRSRAARVGAAAPRHERGAQGEGAMSEWSAAESERRTHEEGFTGGFNPWVVALTVTLATFMEVLDTSIANVSLPHIAGSLSVGQDESTWVLTS